MRLYDSVRAPNPRRVRIFLSEKGLDVPRVLVDLGRFEHRSDAFAMLNPLRRTPVLELDDGTAIAESVAICRYFEEISPEPPLFGRTPLEKAEIEMWNRRMEFELFLPVAHVFRHLHPGMAAHESSQIVDWGEASKSRVSSGLSLLDRVLAQSRFVAGSSFSIADITAICAIDFMKPARLEVPDNLVHLRTWRSVVSSRPSASA
jgi:glutathione S-transferase